MNQFRLAILAYIALVLQTSLSDSLSIVGCTPQFLVLAVFAAICTLNEPLSLFWAAGIGLLCDGVSTGPIGVHIITFTLIAATVPKLKRNEQSLSTPLFALCLFIAAIVTGTTQTISEWGTTIPLASTVSLTGIVQRIVGSAVYTTILGISGIGMSRSFQQLLGPPARRTASPANRWMTTAR